MRKINDYKYVRGKKEKIKIKKDNHIFHNLNQFKQKQYKGARCTYFVKRKKKTNSVQTVFF